MSLSPAIDSAFNPLFNPSTPATDTPSMPFDPQELEIISSLMGDASPSKAADLQLPDLSAFPPEVASLLLQQSIDPLPTPTLEATPSLFKTSPEMEFLAPVEASRKDMHGTPAISMTPLIHSSPAPSLGLYPGDMGHYGFAETQSSIYDPNSTLHQPNLDELVRILTNVSTTASLPFPPTISPAEICPPTATFTPSQYTPSIANTSPLLATPGPGVGISSVASHSAAAANPSTRKKTSPLPGSAQAKRIKRSRSEEDEDTAAAKRRKHTGTRPGITSDTLLAPGDPPQQKTYITESSTSRKDIPASFKVKSGDAVTDQLVNKIVAKRTANRDSARRSRQRKQAAMEAAQDKISFLEERAHQLEDFIRAHGLEVPAPLRTLAEPGEDEDVD